MAKQIGFISNIVGKVEILTPDGKKHIAQLGEALHEGDKVITAIGASVNIIEDNGRPLDIGADQTVSLTDGVVGVPPTAQESVLQPGTTDTVIQALERGTDLNQTLDATAAGLGAGGGDGGGSTFVQLLRIAEGVTGQQYRYGFDPLGIPEVPQGIGPLPTTTTATATTTPPTTEPPVTPPEPPVTPPEPQIPTITSNQWSPGEGNDPTGPGSNLLANGAKIPEGEYAYFRLNIDPSENNSTVTLSLGGANDSASPDDYSPTVQVWINGAWTDYTGSVSLAGTDPQNVYVRVLTMVNSPDGEPDEVFTLHADLHKGDNTVVASTDPTATIYDDAAPPPPPPEPVLPTITVDLEVDPGATKLDGTSTNATSIVVTITGSDGYTKEFPATINPDGTWSIDISGEKFNPDVKYTADALATNNDGSTHGYDNDSYLAPPPPPPPEPLPSVDVDLEVDPGATLLSGHSAHADSIMVTITGSNGYTHDFSATINTDGTWSIDISNQTFDKDVIYTAVATATNTSGTATGTDTDSYTVIDPPPPPEPLPTIDVDLEVDPGATLLSGHSTGADTIVVTVTGSNGYTHDFNAVINPDGTWNIDISGETFNKDVTYTATATATNTSGQAHATDVDSYTIIDPPPPPPPPPEDTGENWFIAQQGNKHLDQAYALHEEEELTFNVQFQDRSGEHIGIIHADDHVGVRIQLSGDALNMLDVLDIAPSNEFEATWKVNGSILEVDLHNIAGKDVNLQGNPFDVTFKVADDGKTGTNTSLGFDILDATVGHAWESNDQFNALISDMVTKNNHNP